MGFKQAYQDMRNGHLIKLPEWGGYWYWNFEKSSIYIHTKDGDELDIRETADVDFTITFMFREDWERV